MAVLKVRIVIWTQRNTNEREEQKREEQGEKQGKGSRIGFEDKSHLATHSLQSK